MGSKNAQEAVWNRLGISLSEAQSGELYTHLCTFLVAKDEYAYVNLLKTKYALLQDGVSLPECDYMIMEMLLEKIKTKYALTLASITYVVRHKS